MLFFINILHLKNRWFFGIGDFSFSLIQTFEKFNNTNIITNDEVMQIIQQEIDKMENVNEETDTTTSTEKETDEESFTSSKPLGLGDKLGLTPPSAPSTEEEPMEEPTETETSAEELPTPEELDVGDLSDNNNPNL